MHRVFDPEHMTTETPGTIPQWTVGDRLRKARLAAGLEQAELAADIGIGRTTVVSYESDRTTPKRLVLRAWALRTGVPVEWLEHGTVPGSGGGPEGERHQTTGISPWSSPSSIVGRSVTAATDGRAAA